MISRRGLIGSLLGLPFGCAAALGAPTPEPKEDNKKWEELAAILLDKFFTHIVYSKFPRHIGPTDGDDTIFRQEIIPTHHLDWELPWLVQHYGDFWYQGVNDCLTKAGIKAIYTMMVTIRKMSNDDMLVTYHAIQGNKLPSPTEDEIGRAMARHD
jgi:hypothetical protein